MTAEPSRDAGERKLLTLLFADVSDYSNLTSQHDPEYVEGLVSPFLAELAAVAAEYGGETRSPQGDGFLAVFGASRTREDDPRRAVLAGERMLSLAAERVSSGRVALGVHLGVATGEVLVRGEVDGGSLTGAAVNLAARLNDKAKTGELLVDARCVDLCRAPGWFSGPVSLEVQGFPGGVVAHRFVGAREPGRPVQGVTVGRGSELAALTDAWEEVLAAHELRVVSGGAGPTAPRCLGRRSPKHCSRSRTRGPCRRCRALAPPG